MPAYNAEKYILQSLDSLKRQTLWPREVIVVDDASTDRTPDILGNYQWDILKVIRLDKNVGPAEANNHGIEIATEEYIAKMDADDISLPKRFERQWEFFQNNSGVAVVGTAALDIDECGVPTGKVRNRIISNFMSTLIYQGNYITHGTAFYPKSMWERCGGYKQAGQPAADYALLLEMSKLGFIENIMETHYLYRVHDKQVSSVREKEQLKKANELRFEAVKERIAKQLDANAHKWEYPLWIYGAGETGILIAEILMSMGHEVAGFFDRSINGAVKGIEVMNLNNLNGQKEGSVIIGSFGYQEPMSAYINYLCPLLKVITIF